MRTSEPWLATVVPVLNEESHIRSCLQSLLQQTLPHNEHIIIVLDGGSDDSTKDIIKTIQNDRNSSEQPEIYLYDNPGRFVPHARNLALKKLPKSITHLLEFNGHIEVEPNHLFQLKSAWDRLEVEHPELAGLGCRVIGVESENTTIESLIDSSLASPLGGSTGQFSNFKHEGPTNVPAFALHRRSAIEAVGGWDESFLTSQDSDLSMRLLKAGFALYRTPSVVVRMRRRTTFKSWFLMSHRYGFWRTKILLKHPRRLVLRELLPLFGAIASGLFLLLYPMGAMILFIVYFGVLAVLGSFQFRKGISHVFGVPFCLLILHTGFTLGLVDGLVRKGRKAQDR